MMQGPSFGNFTAWEECGALFFRVAIWWMEEMVVAVRLCRKKKRSSPPTTSVWGDVAVHVMSTLPVLVTFQSTSPQSHVSHVVSLG
ncbi:hypothetical protein Q3G72_025347 [Acer saccharum]|nr:hypothetical protein Q3G72_008041 [Acer saccharum]KAK1552899.1 hypothetical protein Q3G72_025347 [Acer saccharum]